MAITVCLFHFYGKKLSYEVETLSNQRRSNFYFDLSLKLSQKGVHNFSGEVQKFSGVVQNDLREGAHLPTPPLKIRPWKKCHSGERLPANRTKR
jgi:hypothetical protein